MQDNKNRNYTDLGSIIRDSVMDAVNTGDFTGLSDTIFDTIGSIGNEAKAMAQSYHQKQEDEIQRNKARRSVYVRKPNQTSQSQNTNTARKVVQLSSKYKDIGAVSGILSIVVSIGNLLMALPAFLVSLAMLMDKEFMLEEGAGFVGVFVFCSVWLAIFAVGLCHGIKVKRLRDTAKRYFKLCGDKLYASVEDLARSTGSTRGKTIKKIRKILSKGYFPEGTLDEQETTLILSDEVYKQYKATMNNQRAMEVERLEEMKITAEKVEGLSTDEIAEYNSMIQEGTIAIGRLRELNASIPGEAVTDKLNRLESILEEIFDRLKEHPEQMKNCHKLLDYYLPTMLKLVETYDEYDKISSKGPDILSAMDEIEKTLDSINEAFIQLLNKLFKDSVWDAKADAKVLRTMLNQEGLTNNYDKINSTTAADVIDTAAFDITQEISNSDSNNKEVVEVTN